MILGVLYVGIDGIRNGLGYWQLTARYIVLLYVMKAFDIIVQDQWLVMTVSALTLPEKEYDLATAFEVLFQTPFPVPPSDKNITRRLLPHERHIAPFR